MSISLTEDFKTVEELTAQPRQVLEQVHRTGRPVVITKNGKPDVVILDAATYERKLNTLHLAQLLAEGEAAIKAGQVRSLEEFEEEFFREKKISRKAHAPSRAGRRKNS